MNIQVSNVQELYDDMKSIFYFRIITAALLFSVFGKLNAQHPSPSWAWAKAIYGTNLFENPYPRLGIAVDPSNGAVYTTGSYFGTPDCDPGDGIFNLDSLGIYADMFISKLDDDGNFVWAKQISAVPPGGSSRGYSIAVDPSGSGDIYTMGCFHGKVDFDPGPGTFTLLYSGYSYHNPDVFVSRLDSSGNFKWAKRFGGTGEAWGSSIAVDPLGNGAVYILGSFTGTIDFNPGEDSYLLSSVGFYDFFITKLDLLGNFLWARSIGGIKDDIAFGMAVDSKYGDVYITGDFSGKVNFNPADSAHILTSGPYFDIFILKLDSEGNFVWVKPMFGTGNSKGGAGYAIALDPNGSGDVYTTGYFEGTVDFNPNDKGFFYLNSAGKNDVFISKLNRSGNFVWAKGIGGMGEDKGNTIVFDPVSEGGVYIMGNFAQTADLNPGQDTFNLTSVHGCDLFISKLNSMGDFEWAKPVFGNNAYAGSVLALDGRSLYMAGLFLNPTISFDSLVLTNSSNSREFWDVFIAKLNPTLTTSVAEIKKYQINIYPNPATNELTVVLEGENFQDVGIIMYNILGEIVFSSTDRYAFHKKIIDISLLGTGIYFIEIDIDGNKVVEKVLKE